MTYCFWRIKQPSAPLQTVFGSSHNSRTAFAGTPEDITASEATYIGRFLREAL